ncbi:MAG: hypothetical protein UU16_C0055G0004 [Candidatus Woesebacteria bacterium GW2011_GWA2_40_7]|uniref:Uncharacterized protein n=2 Tax=Candidatus Woeseibacteriota TaxID=1752722 RepID=A0A0G0URN9_9BACT|nr:MAG: hypothetical protein UU16_C0055G0004 [Candidatus Woesebacteria bacterium GW2011_GWA2_40_7]KKR91413.1 MAG: hypothetical protein UU42_C0012G0010 [Candidatus Woesebacteria bacterium GW2011_GWA1_41_13b]
MKIKIIHYPYYKHKIGDLVDLGEELNKSLVSFDRAVWIEPKSIFSKSPAQTETPKIVKPSASQKKLITNNLQERVQEAKKEEVEIAPTKKGSFWDKLK